MSALNTRLLAMDKNMAFKNNDKLLSERYYLRAYAQVILYILMRLRVIYSKRIIHRFTYNYIVYISDDKT